MTTTKTWSAGVYEQDGEGWRAVEWSRHSTLELARGAARRYRASLSASAGGVMSWSAWFCRDGGAATVID